MALWSRSAAVRRLTTQVPLRERPQKGCCRPGIKDFLEKGVGGVGRRFQLPHLVLRKKESFLAIEGSQAISCKERIPHGEVYPNDGDDRKGCTPWPRRV